MAELDFDQLVEEMTTWRRYLHAHPEFGFEELARRHLDRSGCPAANRRFAHAALPASV